MRACTSCGREKHEDDFPLHGLRKRRKVCRACYAASQLNQRERRARQKRAGLDELERRLREKLAEADTRAAEIVSAARAEAQRILEEANMLARSPTAILPPEALMPRNEPRMLVVGPRMKQAIVRATEEMAAARRPENPPTPRDAEVPEGPAAAPEDLASLSEELGR